MPKYNVRRSCNHRRYSNILPDAKTDTDKLSKKCFIMNLFDQRSSVRNRVLTSLSINIFRQQFLNILKHFHNSFSEVHYSFLTISVALRLTLGSLTGLLFDSPVEPNLGNIVF